MGTRSTPDLEEGLPLVLFSAAFGQSWFLFPYNNSQGLEKSVSQRAQGWPLWP